MDLTRSEWRKSIRSGANGGNCIELASWRKAKSSGGNGGNCVEVGTPSDGGIAVRDSKHPEGAVLLLSPDTWRTFTDRVKTL